MSVYILYGNDARIIADYLNTDETPVYQANYPNTTFAVYSELELDRLYNNCAKSIIYKTKKELEEDKHALYSLWRRCEKDSY